MLRIKLRSIWETLHAENHKSFYLAFTRIALSFLLLKELFFNWSSNEILYGNKALVSPKDYGIQKVLFINVDTFQEYHTMFLIAYALLLISYIAGIGKWATALLVFLCYDIIQKQHFYIYSGGERMARLVLLYLVFANSYDYFSIRPYRFKNDQRRKFSNLLSNLASLSVMLQLCLAYFASAVSKLDSKLWQRGIATYYIFMLDSYKGTTWNVALAQQKWFVMLSNYFSIAFELCFPFLIWIKKLRKPLLILGILFHAGIYLFMMIYGFQLVFILCYGFFIPNNTWLNLYRKSRNLLSGKKTQPA